LLKECGIALFRYHDHSHFGVEGHDFISEGFVKALGWKGEFEDILTFVLDEPLTPVEILRSINDKLGAHHGRIAGDLSRPSRKVALLLGARGGEWQDFIRSEEMYVAIGGEVCEWAVCEAVRDASQMGIPKSAIVLGHCLSERDGMKYITELLAERFGKEGIEFRYLECGDTYAEL
ncbi:MAG: Nif3-like dinuclear metal center hexameric protein, partial [Clostridia bacterium]|nr:Nif3-like dinuclear metal center hexameric protein [Clostridia bacterium]